MGYIRHDTVVVTVNDYYDDILKDIQHFQATWPKHLANPILGPFEGCNGYVTYIFCPDGSKEGWELSNEHDELRERFIQIFRDREEAEYVHFQHGGDDHKFILHERSDDDCPLLSRHRKSKGE